MSKNILDEGSGMNALFAERFTNIPSKVDSQLKSIDIMHFGWNIGKAFGIKRIHTATFIKSVFAHTLRDLEISTIERKMSHTESECNIKLNTAIV